MADVSHTTTCDVIRDVLQPRWY